jgi:hypothetical protein
MERKCMYRQVFQDLIAMVETTIKDYLHTDYANYTDFTRLNTITGGCDGESEDGYGRMTCSEGI